MDYKFKTDGCSGGMSVLWRLFLHGAPPWEGDCIVHDMLYWLGGSKADRRAADYQLAMKVLDRGYTLWSILILVGVRIGGHPLLPFTWRWGYGWKYPRGYRG